MQNFTGFYRNSTITNRDVSLIIQIIQKFLSCSFKVQFVSFSYRSIPTHFSNINDEKIVNDIEPVRSKAEEHRLNEKLGPLGIGVE